MPTSSDGWLIWIVIILFLLACTGIIIWFAIDNNIPGPPGSVHEKEPTVVKPTKTATPPAKTTTVITS